MKKMEVRIPNGFANCKVTEENRFEANCREFGLKHEISFPLPTPEVKWEIKGYSQMPEGGQKVILTSKTLLKVTIEKGVDQYGAWVEGIPGIYGAGDSVNEVKEDVLQAIKLYKENNCEIPEELLGEFEIEWRVS